MNDRNEFAQLLAIAHERLVMLDDLKACNISIVYLKGVCAGIFSTLFTLALGWGIWRLI